MKQFLEVHYFTKPGMRDAFYSRIQELGLDVACRAEEGNIQYDYYLNPHNENELVLIELWKDKDAVAFHNGTDHFQKLGEVKKEYVDDVTISRYEIAE